MNETDVIDSLISKAEEYEELAEMLKTVAGMIDKGRIDILEKQR